MSVSSVNSDDVARLAFDQGQGGYGLRGIHGRHGERQREAVQSILPLLKQQLRVPGALAKSDRENVKLALKTASEQGKQCWGPGHVYKKKEYVENAILNLYFQSVVASLHNGWGLILGLETTWKIYQRNEYLSFFMCNNLNILVVSILSGSREYGKNCQTWNHYILRYGKNCQLTILDIANETKNKCFAYVTYGHICMMQFQNWAVPVSMPYCVTFFPGLNFFVLLIHDCSFASPFSIVNCCQLPIVGSGVAYVLRILASSRFHVLVDHVQFQWCQWSQWCIDGPTTCTIASDISRQLFVQRAWIRLRFRCVWSWWWKWAFFVRDAWRYPVGTHAVANTRWEHNTFNRSRCTEEESKQGHSKGEITFSKTHINKIWKTWEQNQNERQRYR